MLRKRSRSRGENSFSEPDEFAHAVLNLYRHVIGGSNGPRPMHADVLEVRQVAFGFAAISQLLKREADRIKSLPFSNDDFTATGLSDAVQLFSALTSGRSHPVHSFTSGLHSARFRANAPPPNDIDQLGRAIVAGAVRALIENGDIRSERQAMQFVCKHLSGSRRLRVEQVKRWIRTFRKTDDIYPLAACNDIMRRARVKPTTMVPHDRIISAAQDMLSKFWTTPKLR